MVTRTPFIVPEGGVIQVAHADPLVFTESAEPVITSPAEALDISATTAVLSVGAADNEGAEGLTYTWSAAGDPPAPVSFSPNGTNSASETTATFTMAGVYQLQVTITNGSGMSATSSVEVTVVSPPFSAIEYEAPEAVLDGSTLTLTTRISIVGHIYHVQSRVDLSAGDWVDVGNPPAQAGTGAALVFTLTRDAGEPRRFYRIVIGR
jgi:hypothetical protein